MSDDDIYNRFDPDKGYDSHLFRHTHFLQSAELNELQSSVFHRLQGVANTIYSDGKVLGGDAPRISGTTMSLFDSALYLRGAIRPVPAKDLIIAVSGEVIIGVYLQEEIISELEDPELLNPAEDTRGFQEPGALRNKITCVWGKQGDGTLGAFYPVYTVVDGMMLQNDPPPQLDRFLQLLARYDRNSNGHYIINGLLAQYISENAGDQVFTVSEGHAHVWGFEVTKNTATRMTVTSEPDLATVVAEPHTFVDSGDGTCVFTLNKGPISSVTQVLATKQTAATITRGPASGGTDNLPDESISTLVSVTQGATTYVQGSDFTFTGDAIDWSPGGAEPSPGTTYTATYNHVITLAPIETTSYTVKVDTALNGTTVYFDYSWKMPRVDRVAMDQTGQLHYIKGVSSKYNPKPANVPRKLLSLARIHQTWTNAPTVRNDGVRVTPMDELEHMQSQIDDLYVLVAEARLKNDIQQSDPTTKKGVFVDPFFDDDLRDTGIAQTAAVVGEELTLAIDATVYDASGPTMDRVETLTYAATNVLEQEKETGNMKINPYQAFEPLPLLVQLEPPVDHFTTVNESISTVTRRFDTWERSLAVTTETVQLVSEEETAADFLRARDVEVHVEELGPNEIVTLITFDGIDVTPDV